MGGAATQVGWPDGKVLFLFGHYSCCFSFHLIHFTWNAEVPGEKSTLFKGCFSYSFFKKQIKSNG